MVPEIRAGVCQSVAPPVSQPGDTWNLAEVFLTIHGERHSLWRAVDQDGHVREVLGQRRRDKKAAKKCFCKFLQGLTYVPREMIMDQLNRYAAPCARSCPVSNIGNTGIRTIAPKTPTTRPASGNDGGSGSSRPGTPGASSPPMARLLALPAAAPLALCPGGSPRNDPAIPELAGNHGLAPAAYALMKAEPSTCMPGDGLEAG